MEIKFEIRKEAALKTARLIKSYLDDSYVDVTIKEIGEALFFLLVNSRGNRVSLNMKEGEKPLLSYLGTRGSFLAPTSSCCQVFLATGILNRDSTGLSIPGEEGMLVSYDTSKPEWNWWETLSDHS